MPDVLSWPVLRGNPINQSPPVLIGSPPYDITIGAPFKN